MSNEKDFAAIKARLLATVGQFKKEIDSMPVPSPEFNAGDIVRLRDFHQTGRDYVFVDRLGDTCYVEIPGQRVLQFDADQLFVVKPSIQKP